MTKELWLNLPVKDIAKSRAFFKHIGFTLNPAHENNPEMVALSVGLKEVPVMLFPEAMFRSFVQHELADTSRCSEMLVSFDAESREEVDELARKVVEAGGNLFAKPSEIQGWMYGCAFADLDGHRWNVLHMAM